MQFFLLLLILEEGVSDLNMKKKFFFQVKDENGDLELKLNTSGNSEDDKNKFNGKIVENGEVDGKGSVRKDNKKDSPPPPTDPEENGEDNSK